MSYSQTIARHGLASAGAAEQLGGLGKTRHARRVAAQKRAAAAAAAAAAADPPRGSPSVPAATASSPSAPDGATDGGLPVWAWGAIGAGVLALVGGVLLIKSRREKAAAAIGKR